MRKQLLALTVILTCSACIVQKGSNLKTLRLIDYEHNEGVEKKVKYQMRVPKEGYKSKSTITGSHEIEHRIIYQDSSLIYMTNDAGGSELNYENIKAIGNKQKTGKLFIDSLSLEGKTNNENFWKEVKLGEICIGYTNVPADKKEIYDNALTTIKRKN